MCHLNFIQLSSATSAHNNRSLVSLQQVLFRNPQLDFMASLHWLLQSAFSCHRALRFVFPTCRPQRWQRLLSPRHVISFAINVFRSISSSFDIFLYAASGCCCGACFRFLYSLSHLVTPFVLSYLFTWLVSLPERCSVQRPPDGDFASLNSTTM